MLQIVNGGFYENRAGIVTGPWLRVEGNEERFCCNGVYLYANGQYYRTARESSSDLIKKVDVPADYAQYATAEILRLRAHVAKLTEICNKMGVKVEQLK